MEHVGPQGEPHRQRALPRRPRSVRGSRHRGPLSRPGLRRDNAEGREKNALAQPQPGTSPPPPSGRGPAREGQSGAKQREAKAATPRRGRPHLPPPVPPAAVAANGRSPGCVTANSQWPRAQRETKSRGGNSISAHAPCCPTPPDAPGSPQSACATGRPCPASPCGEPRPRFPVTNGSGGKL